MKRGIVLLLLGALLLLSACAAQGESASLGAEKPSADIPQELLGTWVSADGGGERQMVETITFSSDGSLTVHLDYQGSPYQTISGSFTVEGGTVHCSITEGTAPFDVDYEFTVDGRELYLNSGDRSSHYLRNS